MSKGFTSEKAVAEVKDVERNDDNTESDPRFVRCEGPYCY